MGQEYDRQYEAAARIERREASVGDSINTLREVYSTLNAGTALTRLEHMGMMHKLSTVILDLMSNELEHHTRRSYPFSAFVKPELVWDNDEKPESSTVLDTIRHMLWMNAKSSDDLIVARQVVKFLRGTKLEVEKFRLPILKHHKDLSVMGWVDEVLVAHLPTVLGSVIRRDVSKKLSNTSYCRTTLASVAKSPDVMRGARFKEFMDNLQSEGDAFEQAMYRDRQEQAVAVAYEGECNSLLRNFADGLGESIPPEPDRTCVSYVIARALYANTDSEHDRTVADKVVSLVSQLSFANSPFTFPDYCYESGMTIAGWVDDTMGRHSLHSLGETDFSLKGRIYQMLLRSSYGEKLYAGMKGAPIR